MYIDTYFDTIERMVRTLRDTQRDAIDRAGVLVSACLRQHGMVHVFDDEGWLRHEASNRAGALFAITPLHFECVVMNPAARRAGDALTDKGAVVNEVSAALDYSNVRQGDVVIIHCFNGVEARAVELAVQCAGRGVVTAGLASDAHMRTQAPRHASEKKLAKTVDIFIDTCVPKGDAVVPVKENERMGPASGMMAACALWAVQAAAMSFLENDGSRPMVRRHPDLATTEFRAEQQRHYVERGI